MSAGVVTRGAYRGCSPATDRRRASHPIRLAQRQGMMSTEFLRNFLPVGKDFTIPARYFLPVGKGH
jgi:hypothetical protein